MNRLFLDRGEMEILTGKKSPSAQIRVLIDMGLSFKVNAINKPIVTIAEVNARMSNSSSHKNHVVNVRALESLQHAKK